MLNNKIVTAIILAAGNSTRFGKNRNKNFEKINEKTILAYSLNAFNQNKYIDNIIVAVKENEVDEVTKIINKELIKKKISLIIGGNSRKQSVYNCIKDINSDIVIIQDGARPLIKQEYITNCVENMNEFKGVTIGIKSKDTIKVTDKNNIVINTTNRDNTWIIQTPQCFERLTLLKVHEKYKNEEATDDCLLLERDNYKVKVIQGEYNNIKITTEDDFEIVKRILMKNKKISKL